MKKTLIILGIFAFIASSYGQSSIEYYKHPLKDKVDSLYNVLWNLVKEKKGMEAMDVFNEYITAYDILATDSPGFNLNDMYWEREAFADNLLFIAKESEEKKEYHQTKQYCQRSVEIYQWLAQKRPDEFMVQYADVLVRFGRILHNFFNDYETAEKYWLHAKTIYESQNPEETDTRLYYYSIILRNLGLNCYEMKRYDEAEQYYLHSLSIRRQLVDKNPDKHLTKLTYIYDKLGDVYLALKKQPEAKTYFQQAFDIYNTAISKNLIEVSDLAEGYGNHSWNLLLLGEIAESEQHARKALELDNSKSFAKVNLAHALLLQNHYREAKKLYEEIMPKHKQEIIDDLNALEHEGIIPDKRMSDVEKIRKLIQNTPTKRLSYPMLQKKRKISNFFARR